MQAHRWTRVSSSTQVFLMLVRFKTLESTRASSTQGLQTRGPRSTQGSTPMPESMQVSRSTLARSTRASMVESMVESMRASTVG